MALSLAMGMPACVSGNGLPPLGRDAVVLAFGDSLTYGTGAAPSESYPAVLARLIGRRVVNEGIPGEVTAEGLARLPGVLKREKPALLILCHGANDLLRGLGRQQASANLKAMIRLARDKGSAVALIAVPSPGPVLSAAPLYREVARDLGLPLEEKVLTTILSSRNLLSDPIHPNAAGYRLLAESVATLLIRSGALK